MDNEWILAWQGTNGAPSEMGDEPVIEGQTPESELKTQSVSDPNDGTGKDPGFFARYGQLIFIILIFVVMYFFLLRGPKKRQQEHRQMVQKLKKNDRVRTIGGIIGTIVEIKENEITLKIDESNNTKMKIAASAIAQNLSIENKE